MKYQNVPTVITQKDQSVVGLDNVQTEFDIESNEETLFQSTNDDSKTDEAEDVSQPLSTSELWDVTCD